MLRTMATGLRMTAGLIAGVLATAAAILLAVAAVFGARGLPRKGQLISPQDIEARVPPGWIVAYGLGGSMWYASHTGRGIETSAPNAIDLLDIIHGLEGSARRAKRKAQKS